MPFCSFADVVEGLHDCYATVLNVAEVQLLDYEPQSIQEAPLLYTLLVSFRREQKAQITAMHYRVLSRLVLQWQDSEQAEAELRSLVNALPASVDANPTLTGRITMGLARITDGETGMLEVSDSKYKILDIYADVVTKAAVLSGI